MMLTIGTQMFTLPKFFTFPPLKLNGGVETEDDPASYWVGFGDFSGARC